MAHDEFETERYRVERVLEILEHAADRLEARAHVPVSLLRDAVEFVRTSEAAAYDATTVSAGEPPLSACVQQHIAARVPLAGMQHALHGLEANDATAAGRFVGCVRDYVRLRREHLSADDKVLAIAARAGHANAASSGRACVESADLQQVYDRLVDAAAMLEIGMPTEFPHPS